MCVRKAQNNRTKQLRAEAFQVKATPYCDGSLGAILWRGGLGYPVEEGSQGSRQRVVVQFLKGNLRLS